MNVYHRCHKLFSGVNDTGEKFITGVNDTADKLFPVLLTLVRNNQKA
jgi:hypothetical protein